MDCSNPIRGERHRNMRQIIEHLRLSLSVRCKQLLGIRSLCYATFESQIKIFESWSKGKQKWCYMSRFITNISITEFSLNSPVSPWLI
jgi:hypothetical protein